MKTIGLDIRHAVYFAEKEFDALKDTATAASATLDNGTGAGSDFTGWVTLPSETSPELVERINATAKRLRDSCEYVVCIGIGGSYLGAKAVTAALQDNFADHYLPRPSEPKLL